MKKKDGYILDSTYPIFFYKELTPLWLNSTINFLGFKTPNISENFSYLELACATGINLIVNAINNPNGHFVGVDFNQKHIEIAKQNANEIGLKNIEFICCDFATFFEKNKRKFDFIVNHGTFSWVSPDVQKNILNIVSSSLKNFGIFYLHYMCYPASATLLPIQKLFNIVDSCIDEPSSKSVEIAKNLFDDLNIAGAFVHNPKIDSIIKTLNQSSDYLAHEFLTDFWNPLYSVDVHKMVYENTKTTFLGSANIVENIENISIPAKLQEIIKNTNAPDLKEYLKDLARNSKQRVDIFQKNPQIFENSEYIKIINEISFKLIANISKKDILIFKTLIGNIEAPKEISSIFLDALSKKDMTFQEILSLTIFKDNTIFLIETIFLLLNENYIHFASKNYQSIDKRYIENFAKLMKKEGVDLKLLPDCGTAI